MGGVRGSAVAGFRLGLRPLPGAGRLTSLLRVCCRNHVPQVVCVVGSLPHRLGRVPVLLLPGETELGVHQLLQHPSLQRAPAQEKEQLRLGPSAMASQHHLAPQDSPFLGTLLKAGGDVSPSCIVLLACPPLLPEILLGVLLSWVGRGICSFSSFGNRELSVKKKRGAGEKILMSSEYVELEFWCVLEGRRWDASWPHL